MQYKSICLILIINSLFFAIIGCTHDKKQSEKRISKFHDIINTPTYTDGSIDTSKMAHILLQESFFDFGIVQEGQVVVHTFTINNDGKSDLYILDSKSSCGCTVSEYSDKAISPNSTSEIKIKFDTKGKNGIQEKNVSIFTNSIPNETIFAIRANVVK